MRCSNCGVPLMEGEYACPKCDLARYEHNHRQFLTVDIAHNHQTVEQAREQCLEALLQAEREEYAGVRLIVGGGKINGEIGQLLDVEHWKGRLKSVDHDGQNRGAYLALLTRAC